jgi:nucleosome binding factor SPN SPT16 subunit
MGMEFRDSTYLLSPKNSRQLKANMVFCLSIGFQDLEDQEHKRYVGLPLALGIYQFLDRYALQINDSVKIGQDKGICITEGVKSAKDTLFYLTRDDSEEEKVRQKPPTKTNGNASPMKNKTAGGKVLRNKTRGATQEEAQSTGAKIAEHQKELHNQLQEQGLARYSEEGDGANGKEGKAWKKFQSYKGEAGLPKEVETLRVRRDFLTHVTTLTPIRFSWTANRKLLSYLSMGLQFRST